MADSDEHCDRVLGPQELTAEIFRQALAIDQIDSCDDGDGDIRFRLDGFLAFIRLNKARNLIRLYAIFGFKEDAPEIEKLRFSDKVNDRVFFLRSCLVANQKSLVVDWSIPTDAGLSLGQIGSFIRRFGQNLRLVLELDKSDLLK